MAQVARSPIADSSTSMLVDHWHPIARWLGRVFGRPIVFYAMCGLVTSSIPLSVVNPYVVARDAKRRFIAASRIKYVLYLGYIHPLSLTVTI